MPVGVAIALLEEVGGRRQHLGGRVAGAVELEGAERPPLRAHHVERERAVDAARGRVLPGPAAIVGAVAQGLDHPVDALRALEVAVDRPSLQRPQHGVEARPGAAAAAEATSTRSGTAEATITCSAPAASASVMPAPAASVGVGEAVDLAGVEPALGEGQPPKRRAHDGGSRPVTTASKRQLGVARRAQVDGAGQALDPPAARGAPRRRERGPALVAAGARRAARRPVSRSAVRTISSRKPGWPRFSLSTPTSRLPSSRSEGAAIADGGTAGRSPTGRAAGGRSPGPTSVKVSKRSRKRRRSLK